MNVTGTATVPPTGNGTVVTSLNTLAGLRINQTPGGAGALGTITGLVSWGNSSDGARLFGGSKVKIRNSVFGASTRYGVLVGNDTSGSGTAAQRLDVSAIDLGTMVGSDWGNNWLQTPTISLGRNTQTGLCVNLGANTATGTVRADGNELDHRPHRQRGRPDQLRDDGRHRQQERQRRLQQRCGLRQGGRHDRHDHAQPV